MIRSPEMLKCTIIKREVLKNVQPGAKQFCSYVILYFTAMIQVLNFRVAHHVVAKQATWQ